MLKDDFQIKYVAAILNNKSSFDTAFIYKKYLRVMDNDFRVLSLTLKFLNRVIIYFNLARVVLEKVRKFKVNKTIFFINPLFVLMH